MKELKVSHWLWEVSDVVAKLLKELKVSHWLWEVSDVVARLLKELKVSHWLWEVSDVVARLQKYLGVQNKYEGLLRSWKCYAMKCTEEQHQIYSKEVSKNYFF